MSIKKSDLREAVIHFNNEKRETLICHDVIIFFNDTGINLEGDEGYVFVPYGEIQYISVKKNKEDKK